MIDSTSSSDVGRASGPFGGLRVGPLTEYMVLGDRQGGTNLNVARGQVDKRELARPGQARPRAAGGFQGRRSGATSACPFSNAGQLAAARGGRWT